MSWCPTCRAHYPEGQSTCAKDGAKLAAGLPPVAPAAARSPGAGVDPRADTSRAASPAFGFGNASPSNIPKTLVRMPPAEAVAESNRYERTGLAQPTPAPIMLVSPVSRADNADDEPSGVRKGGPEITLREMVMDLQAGHKVGEYVVERRLGEGGMAVVYAGVHPLIGKKVAIKLLAPALAADQDMVRRFVGEARAVNQIGHRHIVDIFAFGQLPDGRHYFVMELLEGESLAERMSRHDSPLSPGEVLEICQQIVSAIAAAHQRGIVHRDLKPENLFLVASDGGPYVKVLDFGIAKLLGPGTPELSKTATGMPMGTPTYMSPEQTAGRGVDQRTDIYALGVILFQMVTGRPPFESDNYVEVLHAHLTQVPPPLVQFADAIPELESLVARMLAKRPEDRPQSMDEVRQALVALEKANEQGGRPLFARRAGARPHAAQAVTTASLGARPAQSGAAVARSWRLALAVGGLAFVGILVAVAVPSLRNRESTPAPPAPAPEKRVVKQPMAPPSPTESSATIAAVGAKADAPTVPTPGGQPAQLIIDIEPPEVQAQALVFVNDALKRPDELTSLPPGVYRVVAKAPGYAAAAEEVTLKQEEKRSLRLVLRKLLRRRPDVAATSAGEAPTGKPKAKPDAPSGPIDRNATLKPDFGP